VLIKHSPFHGPVRSWWPNGLFSGYFATCREGNRGCAGGI
jgi:hypothetical protein